jgi:hypothetical protein
VEAKIWNFVPTNTRLFNCETAVRDFMHHTADAAHIDPSIGVREMIQAPQPPVTRWERHTAAAARCGIPPRAFLDLVNHDPLLRVQRLGKRQLLHVAANDVDALAVRLQHGGVR